MEQPAPEVTVLVAAYDAEAFVERAITSALTQQGPSLEVVVVDDASRDRTRAVVRALADHDPRVRLVALDVNGGPAAARNAGIAAARGAWVAVLDADDAFRPGRLATLVALGEGTGADVVADPFELYDPRTDTVTTLPFRTGATRTVTLHDYLAQARPDAPEPDYGLLKPVWRAAFLERTGLRYPGSRHGEDFLVMASALLAGARYVLAPVAGYRYTTPASGWSRTAVDRQAMVAQSQALLEHPGVRGDSRAAELLEQRIAAVREYAARREVDALLAARDVVGLVRAVAARPALLPVVLRRVARAGRGRRAG